MKRNVLIFGLVLGTLLAVNMVVVVNMLYQNPNMEPSALIGYTVQIVVFSVAFFGIRNYRDKALDGVISFGKAFKVAAFIVLIASTLYVVTWLFYYYLFVPDFLEHYEVCVINQVTRDGATQAELAETKANITNLAEMYKNPLMVVAITYMEVLPVGLVVALVSALILKKKPAVTVPVS
jgi:Protein of unknown function (DUF4199)